MPGMMDTVLNIGLNDESVQGLAKQAGSERFAWDSYRRLIQMFGKTVLDIDGEHFEDAIDEAKKAKGTENDLDLDEHDLRELVDTFKGIVREHAGREFPTDPREQMDLAVRAVFDSWNAPRAILYRRQERIPADLGTAVNVVRDGVRQPRHGLRHRRRVHPRPGLGPAGHLRRLPAERAGRGRRRRHPQHVAAAGPRADRQAGVRRAARQIMETLENHYRDLCDIEFTIERNKLWMLQTRVGKRTAGAAFRIATPARRPGADRPRRGAHARHRRPARAADVPALRRDGRREADRQGHERLARCGRRQGGLRLRPRGGDGATTASTVILVRRETNPDDLNGHDRRAGHPDQPRRQDLARRRRRARHGQDLRLRSGGARGRPQGAASSPPAAARSSTRATSSRSTARPAPSTSARCRCSRPRSCSTSRATSTPTSDEADDLVEAVHRLHDPRRRASAGSRCAPTPTPPRTPSAPAGSAPQGIGLCRTEHMFLGERRQHVEDAHPGRRRRRAEAGAGRAAAAAARRTSSASSRRWTACPSRCGCSTRRCTSSCPTSPSSPCEVAVAEAKGEDASTTTSDALLDAVRRLHEQNPMLGLRGVRLGLVVPGLFAMQVRAIAEAAAAAQGRRQATRSVEIMVPLVGAVQELEVIRDEARADPRRGRARRPVRTSTALIGTMIEVPRAALTAGQIAEAAEFFSFGTNDLTQMALGLLPRRRRGGVLQPLPRARHLRGLAVRVARPRRRRPAGAHRRPRRAARRGPTSSRRLRRARRRPRLDPLLPRGRPRLRLLLAVPRPGRTARGRPGAPSPSGGQRQPVTHRLILLRVGRQDGCGRADARLVVLVFTVMAPASGGSRARTTAGISDAIVVLGAAQFDGRPSSVFTARLVHARDLYQDDVAPRIVTVGGTGRVTASPRRRREAMAAEHGVPASRSSPCRPAATP